MDELEKRKFFALLKNRGANPDTIIPILEANPQFAYGSLSEIKIDFIHVWPTPERLESGSYGRTALHIAVAQDLPTHIIRAIRDANPDAMLALDDRGNTPLHLIYRGTPIETIRLFPIDRIAPIQNQQGHALLHLAAYMDFPTQLITEIIAASPIMAQTPDIAGRLPLHLLLDSRYMPRLSQVKPIYDAFPDAVRMRNTAGNLPLVMYIERQYYAGTRADILKVLLTGYPSAIVYLNGELRHILNMRGRDDPELGVIIAHSQGIADRLRATRAAIHTQRSARRHKTRRASRKHRK
jgi:hypothetical protein